MIEIYKKIEYSEPSNSFQIQFIKRNYTPISECDLVSEQVTGQVTGQVSEQVSEQVHKILSACKSGEKSKKELLAAVGLSNAYLNYQRHIVPLLGKKILEMTIPDKPKSRLQKYRLTEKGENLIESSNNKKI